MIDLSVKAKVECWGLFRAGIRHDVSEQFLSLGEACFSFASVLRFDCLKFFWPILAFTQMFGKSFIAIPQFTYPSTGQIWGSGFNQVARVAIPFPLIYRTVWF